MPEHTTRRFWNSRAEDRSQKEDRDEFIRLAGIYEECCWRAIEPVLPPSGAVVLEAGCGTGRWVRRLTQKGLKTLLLDFSPDMVRVARQKVEESGLQASVAGYHVQDICDMAELADGGVDCVVCLGEPLGLCDDPARAAAEMCRVLKPGGALVCDAANRLRQTLDMAVKNDWASAEKAYSQGVLHADDGRPHWCFSEADLAALLRKAGFDVERITPATPLLSFPPAPGLLRDLMDDEIHETVQTLFARMEQDPEVMGISARLLAVARKPLDV